MPFNYDMKTPYVDGSFHDYRRCPKCRGYRTIWVGFKKYFCDHCDKEFKI